MSIYNSIRELKDLVEICIRRDSENLKKGYPPCYKTFNDCKVKCKFSEDCKKNTINIDIQDLKNFGI